MITLYTFGPFLGTPDSSPFVIKAMLLLQLAQLDYKIKTGNPFKAPHGLLPFIEDDGLRVADSTSIRRHIERKYGMDFDRGLEVRERAIAFAAERLCEDHLYFAALHGRWLDPEVFAQGLGRHMFSVLPAPARPLAKVLLKSMNARRLHGHGLGRLSQADRLDLAGRDLETLSALVGSKSYLMGDQPCGADATVFGVLTAIVTPPLDMPLRQLALRHANLLSYCARLTARWFPSLGGSPESFTAVGEPVRW